MADESPGTVFDATFTENVTRTFVSAVQRAYETAREHHDPDRGSNEATFGFQLYHFNVHELSRCGDEPDPVLSVKSKNPTFRITVGDYELCCHRVGRNATDDIWRSTPSNEGAACTMVEEQLWLANVPKRVGIEQARKLVIAHLGNAEDGLGAIYLCVPGKVRNDRVVEWAYAHQIWGVAEGFVPPVTASKDVAPDEVIEEAQLRRKPKKEEREEEDT